jgi:outer membrane protein assembly factor BamA
LGALSSPPAHAQLRGELIESARTEKAANLTPEAPPKAERIIVGVESSVPYRLLTGELKGFGVGFGTIVPGAGFAIGPHYRRGELLGGRLSVSVEARAAVNRSYLGRLSLAYAPIPNGRTSVDLSIVHRDISEMPYYGAGPDSEKSGRSDYRLEDTNLELRPSVGVYKGLRTGLVGSYLAVNVGQGHSSRYISTDQQFGAATTPGIDRQTNFLRGGGFVEYDWRDRASSPTRGGKYSAQYVRYLDRDAGAYSFLRLDLDATQYIPFFNRTRVIAVHGASSFTTTNDTQRVPFYVQPTLGGPDTLRGYRINRFYGDNSVMVNAEYRWELSPVLDMAAFVDAGKVFNRWEQWNLHQLESDVGFGLRVKGRSRTAFSIDTGFSHEGFQIWFRANNLF